MTRAEHVPNRSDESPPKTITLAKTTTTMTMTTTTAIIMAMAKFGGKTLHQSGD